MAGILSNIIVLLIIKLFRLKIYDSVYYFNLIMLLINLLPIYPLDGYRIVSKIINKIFDPLYTFDFLFWISLFFILLGIIISYFFRIYFVILIFILLTLNLIFKRKKEVNALKMKSLYNILIRVK